MEKKEHSPVTEFKRRNGFERLDYPRYYVPLTLWGRLALRSGFHRELLQILPEWVTNFFLATRAAVYRRRFGVDKGPRNGGPRQELSISSSSSAL